MMARTRMKRSDDQLFRVRAKGSPVQIRLGPGLGYSAVLGKIVESEPVEIVETSEGPGSKTGWGRLSNDGWIALDFVEKV